MMTKTLLVLCGVGLLAAPSLHAQDRRFGGSHAYAARHYAGDYNRFHRYGDGRHHHYGRYYYYGGVPYFYPFFGLGFGYPAYAYNGWYGDGFAGGSYGYGEGAGPGVYEGRITNDDPASGKNGAPSNAGPSLPEAVQRQLAKKGYYKGSVDGQFGPMSRSALTRFQHDHDLKETGRIDEDTLDTLGFTDHQ